MTTNTGTVSRDWINALPVVMLLATGSTTANAQSTIGNAQSVKPEASGSISGILSAGSGVHANETIKTGSAGQAALQFNDKSNLSVGPSSQVRLDKFVYDPNKGTSGVAIEATRGAFRFASQGKGEVRIKTPLAPLAFAVELTTACSGGFHVRENSFRSRGQLDNCRFG